MADVDFHVLKILNHLSRHKRGDLINTFFDARSATFGIHAVVGELFNVTQTKSNTMIGGKSTETVCDLIIKKLEEKT